ncbi:MAG TPA: FAD-dependent oxidoreductase [Chitinophagaceae bacterium]|nr:FAD-dependent oxidoreductase [Chitinophagaceae bacterium]MCB9055836.1 FAD-dependent oxidoreductase [Chitinophagales bacterium]HPG10728.1 FAD-dependent oxidoreductase [Chitinophagaceae bacterium]
MAKALVIGGGIIGLSSAFYLHRSGWDVTVLDKSDFNDNCSYGNCGYICPSHFIPLATPGVVKQGLKWMLNSKSPFYVQPRLDRDLISWGLKFIRSANNKHVNAAATPLRDISLFSKKEYESWLTMPEFDFAYEQKGLLEIFQTDHAEEHAKHTVEKAHEIGLTDTRLLTADELQALEPHTKINGRGAIHFNCDAHCFPNKLMQQLISYLKVKGVKLIANQEVNGFEKEGGRIKKVLTPDAVYDLDEVVIATGSWARGTIKLLDTKIPLMPGRGYSVTLENSPYKVNYPAVLVEGRAAITPMNGNKIRFGGTMEITSHKTAPRMNRVQGILDAVKRYYPEFDVALPAKENIWYGYRPCSADGLPYIGRINKYKNVTVATGHSMLGLSLGAGTGKLVDQVINNNKTGISLDPFRPERFS